MPSFGQVAFGLRQVKLTNSDGSGAVYLPTAMLLHFVEKSVSTEFSAEGQWIAARSISAGLEWELESGIIDLAAFAKLTGYSTVSGGLAPNRTITLSGATGTEYPYIRIYGRAVGEGTDDIHCVIYRAKLQEIEGTFRTGQFWITSCAGIAVKDSSSGLYQFVQHETGVSL